MFIFFNDTATTEIYTLSLHDALPIFNHNSVPRYVKIRCRHPSPRPVNAEDAKVERGAAQRQEDHTPALEAQPLLICRILLEGIITSLPPSALNDCCLCGRYMVLPCQS